MRLIPTTISLISCVISIFFSLILTLALLSVVAMGCVSLLNLKRFNLDHYVKTTARVVDYKITLTHHSSEKHYITINLEYSVNNSTISSWTDDKKIESRSVGEKYFTNLDKDNTPIIYRKDNTHEAVILPVNEKFKSLWKGWVVIGSVLITTTVSALLCYYISFTSFLWARD